MANKRGNNRGGQRSPKVNDIDQRVKAIEEYLNGLGDKINKTANDYDNMSFLINVIRGQSSKMEQMNMMMKHQQEFGQKFKQYLTEKEMADDFDKWMQEEQKKAEEERKQQLESMKEKKDTPEDACYDCTDPEKECDCNVEEPPAPEEESE